jgi:hypothetical protein
MQNKPHIVLIIARGEAVRNFLYSDTLRILGENAHVTLLSAINDQEFYDRFGNYVEKIIPLKEYPENRLVTGFRYLIHTAHYRWMWNENAKWASRLHDYRAITLIAKIRRVVLKSTAFLLANRFMLEALTRLERLLSWKLRPNDDFVELFQSLKPDLVFNCSHIHGSQADLPMRVAGRLGIRTAVFIFSWDNLYTRSRIFVPYDHYLMWNEDMKQQLLHQYREINSEQVVVTGTPQFDFHFKNEYRRRREYLCKEVGIDPTRPYILYTTGMDSDFLEEHKIVEAVIQFIQNTQITPKPQLVVRTYVKGTTEEMKALGRRGFPNVVFPPVLWKEKWIMPMYDDLFVYSNLLHYASLGINGESTVSLEMMMFDKPVINLGFDPPGSRLPDFLRLSRFINSNHYRPVVRSGSIMIARSISELYTMIERGLTVPQEQSRKRKEFLKWMFADTLDGHSGQRVAEQLLHLASH